MFFFISLATPNWRHHWSFYGHRISEILYDEESVDLLDSVWSDVGKWILFKKRANSKFMFYFYMYYNMFYLVEQFSISRFVWLQWFAAKVLDVKLQQTSFFWEFSQVHEKNKHVGNLYHNNLRKSLTFFNVNLILFLLI
jgi:hypothetical protein